MLNTNKITALVPSIDFPCVVNGKRLTASITHIEDNAYQAMFHIRFSDGYSSKFFATGGEHYPWADESKSWDYVMAIESDLNALGILSPKQEVYLIVTDTLGKEDVNVWIKQSLTEPKKYSVYYLDDYRFTIERAKGGWNVYDIRNGRKQPIHSELAQMVCKHIDATLQ